MTRISIKLVMIVLMTALILTLFVGCGQKETPKTEASTVETKAPEKTEEKAMENPADKFANKDLEVAVFEGGYGKAYWEAVIDKFQKDYTGVKITLVASPKIDEMMKPRFVAGNPPDFCLLNPSSYASEGALAELNDVFESKALDKDIPLKDKIIDGFLAFCTPLDDGKIYYAPTNIGGMGVLYNKKYFESKGWKAPKTWDEFFALGDLAKKEGKALYTYQGIYPGYNEMMLYAGIASSAGMDALNKILNYEEGAWRDPKVKRVLEIFYKIAQGDYLMKGTTALNHTLAQTEFLKGNALFLPCGNWFENEMKDAIPKEGWAYGFMPAPVFSAGDQQYVESGCEYMFIPKKAKNIELAKEFLKYQYIDENVILLAQKSTGIAAVKGVTEMVKEYVPASSYETMKVFDSGVKPLFIKWKATPPTQIKISDEIFNPITSIMNKKLTVDEWVERIEKATAVIREDIKKAGK